ncbi:MAG: dienelactone hydrolase family protein [Novosphingobium sp.]
MTALDRVDFDDRGTALTGWLARPEGPARAAILVFPTIANVLPAIERRAAMLAEQGYLAMIADFYGEPVADFAAARPLAEALRGDVDHYRARLTANLAALRQQPDAAGLPLGAIGFCMGGQAALELARAGEDLAVIASFHGLLDTARKAEAPLHPRILVCHGDQDPMVPRAQVLAFWEEMDAAKANWHFHAYSGVRHGFTDPTSDSRGLAAVGYDASADRQSWTALLALFDEVFAPLP